MRRTLLFTPVCVFSFFFFVCFLSSLVWFFLWLPEEVLTLLFLLHCENGDFSILMKVILLICQQGPRFHELSTAPPTSEQAIAVSGLLSMLQYALGLQRLEQV